MKQVDSHPPSPTLMLLLSFVISFLSIYTTSSSAKKISFFDHALIPVAYAASPSWSSSLSTIKRRKGTFVDKEITPFIPRGGSGDDTVNTNERENNESNDILVIGSLNADTFLPVTRLPTPGENICIPSHTQPSLDVPGGKGCTQAIACSSLLSSPNKVTFLGQFGNDPAASTLQRTLQDANVEISDFCGTCRYVASGRGYVFRSIVDGSVSAVVSGGSNMFGWGGWRHLYDNSNNSNADRQEGEEGGVMTETNLSKSLLCSNVKCILLQREIPEFVNSVILREAKRDNRDIIVIQDVGGEDRPISSETLSYCDYLIPNKSELKRLVHSFEKNDVNMNGEDDDTMEKVIEYAKILQKYGAKNVLVTLGSDGSLLVPSNADQNILYQKACKLPDNVSVADETGAGDCYRAAFAVALTENKSLEECMRFASAAGALSVTKEGAVPSVPSRNEVEELFCAEFGDDEEEENNYGDIFEEEELMEEKEIAESIATSLPRGGDDDISNYDDEEECPLLFGSRLNSMKDRPDLCPNTPLTDVRDWVKRQGTISGLNVVDFNYPQHFHTFTSNAEAKQALEEQNLVAGAVCLRYPSKFARGAMIHPDPALRREAIEITKEAARAAQELGCDEVVVWSAYDGYDYPFQVNYDDKWNQIVEAFRECCDAYPDVKFSLEFKPTDENTRFFTVPSTGAALLLVKEIDRPNMGLTLDVGHMLMAGENPGQSIAMVGREKKLFGVQLNDGYTRLAAEDGMMFGSIHPSMALEVMYQLRKTGYKGHMYFDTFPQRTDPVKEAEYNIRRVKEFWKAAGKLDKMGLQKVMDDHDALAALDITNKSI